MQDARGSARSRPGAPALDGLDRRLIAEVVADPAAPYTVWAERLGVSDRTVTRRYLALRDRDVVRVRGRTVPGFDGRLAWLTRTVGTPTAMARLGAVVAGFPHSRWVRLSADGTELTAGLVTSGRGEDVVLSGLTGRRGAERTRVVELLRVWGSSRAVDRAPRPLDAADRALLDALAADGRASLAQLAHATGLSPSTASRRRAQLVEEGVVYFEADVDVRALGEDGDALVWITAAPGAIRRVGRILADLPEVRFVAATSGPTSLVANVVASSAGDLVDVIDTHLDLSGVHHAEIAPQGPVLKRSPSGWG
ncbi:AsnC family transcriptional regulator [Micrococcus sp.]|uniref:AsnC family transcriptional regulator n=1 Tax=Micrococcus sp. TaxID=1271 RepID=UPI002A914235|nr:AsnC family transcriptional regulator [Micrococcus sp.]MDY6054410.1 AsnC family transcriptional regulator [Micrococcus sp.]